MQSCSGTFGVQGIFSPCVDKADVSCMTTMYIKYKSTTFLAYVSTSDPNDYSTKGGVLKEGSFKNYSIGLNGNQIIYY